MIFLVIQPLHPPSVSRRILVNGVRCQTLAASYHETNVIRPNLALVVSCYWVSWQAGETVFRSILTSLGMDPSFDETPVLVLSMVKENSIVSVGIHPYHQDYPHYPSNHFSVLFEERMRFCYDRLPALVDDQIRPSMFPSSLSSL
jgi:hypothetical protein